VLSAATASGMARANSAALRQALAKIALAPTLGAPSGRRRTLMFIHLKPVLSASIKSHQALAKHMAPEDLGEIKFRLLLGCLLIGPTKRLAPG